LTNTNSNCVCRGWFGLNDLVILQNCTF